MSNRRHQISCVTRNICETVVGDRKRKYLTKSIESRLQLKSKLYGFQMKKGYSVNEHLNRYTKFLTDLVNVDVEVNEEDKAVILLNSLPVEEYETFTLTFVNGRQSINYYEVSMLWLIMRQGERKGSLLR